MNGNKDNESLTQERQLFHQMRPAMGLSDKQSTILQALSHSLKASAPAESSADPHPGNTPAARTAQP